MVARFDSMQERDTAIAIRFTKRFEVGFDKLTAYLRLMPRKPIVESVEAIVVDTDDSV
jgi:hypothetical protein